jgi:hypothetical protein
VTHERKRRIGAGGNVEVHRNAGFRKVCKCPRRGWAKCPHSWHFNFAWRGVGRKARQSRRRAVPTVSPRVWQRSRRSGRQCSTSLADGGPASSRSQTGLDLEKEDRPE